MRVALLHPFSWPQVRRGGERYLHDLAWAIADSGHEPHVVTSGPRGTSCEEGVTTHRIGTLPSRRYGMAPEDAFGFLAARWLIGHRFDLVHALVPSAALGARMSRHRTVFTSLGHPTTQWAAKHQGEARLLKVATRAATEVTALSTSAQQAFEEVTGRAPALLPPGIRIERFSSKLAPADGPPVVLFASAPHARNKRLNVLVSAFARVLDAHPDARLRIGASGDTAWAFTGEGAERVRAACDLLGDGEIDEVPDRYRDATVTVLPSELEAFGLVLVESLACGTPVVGTTSGGIPDIVSDERVGRLCPPRDPEALAAAIVDAIALARRPGTTEACAAHARQWDWSSVVGPAHLALYAKVAS